MSGQAQGDIGREIPFLATPTVTVTALKTQGAHQALERADHSVLRRSERAMSERAGQRDGIGLGLQDSLQDLPLRFQRRLTKMFL